MNKNFFAILLKSLSVFFIVSMDVLIKKLSTDFPTFQIIFFRCLFGLIPVTFMLIITNSQLKTKKFKIHIVRAMIATVVMFAFFKAVSILPLADVSSISFASIMITTILAIFILKEKVGIRRWFAIIFGFLGVIIVFRPGTSIFSYYSFLPLIAALGLSFAVILLKQLLIFDKPPTCSFYLHALIALFVFPTILINWQIPNLNQMYLLILMGLFGGIAQILATNAFKLSNVSVLIPFDYSAIIWAVTFGIIFFNNYPDKYVIIGSIVIVLSTYYIIYRERIRNQNFNSLKINTRQA
tara:strand:+ start:520 stop:1407 length:888 start_codon:yes stop_codon:yes gene_type:complete